ncbi:glutamine--fructose-6-phosphate aminotransferase, partial [Vibrio sp. 10N.222.55.E8]
GTVVIDRKDPSRIVVARSGSPIVIGFGVGENFLASDQLALLNVTRRFMYLEEGDVAEVTRRDVTVFDSVGERVEREIVESNVEHDAGDKGQYRHFMQKEIFEQPTALINTMEG